MSHLDESPILREYGGKIKNDLNALLSSDNIDDDIDLSSFSPYVTIEQLPSYVSQVKEKFSILTLNCQCINSKFDDLYIILNELSKKDAFKFSVINIQETWVRNEANGDAPDVSMYKLPGYKTFALGASCSSKGGLFCYVADSINACTRLTIDSSDIWEGIFIDLDFDTTSLILGNVYRPPRSNNNNQSIERFVTEFKPVLENISKANKNIVLSGDFNIDLLKLKEREKYSEFFDIMLSMGFLPKITFPTRFAKKSASLIDQIFIKSRDFMLNQNSKSGILHSSLSDHYAAFTSLSFKQPSKAARWVTIHKQDDLSLMKFSEAIKESNLLTKINHDIFEDPNSTYEILQSTISSAKNEFLPSKRVRFNKYKHKKNKWITTAIIKSIHVRDKLYHKFKTTRKTDVNYSSHKKKFDDYSKLLNKLIKDAKTTYYNNEFEKYQNDIRKCWQTINCILNRDRNSNNFPSYIKVDGKKVTSHQDIVDNFNNYFTSVGESLAAKIPRAKKSYDTYLKDTIASSFSFKLVEQKEIDSIITKFKAKTSSGMDGISMKLLKLIKVPLVPCLTILVNQSLTTGIFPSDFKIAKVTPLIKKPNILDIDNFRPISLLASISKVVEKCVFNQLYSYFEKNNLLYGSQYGYRDKHSTELACLELVDKVMHHLDQGETPFCFFLDLSKAFDTLDHKILLNKLKYYGVVGTSLKWFNSYLSNRSQYVDIDGVKSDPRGLTTGVPQGSILGPLLFIIYMNDINKVTDKFESILYADDTSLNSILKTFSSNDQVETATNINKELMLIYDWLLANKLSLNIKKTKYMIFRYPQRPANSIPDLSLYINNHMLDRVDTFDFLGLTISETLSWKNHVDKISIKISKVIGILARCKRYIHTSVMIKIYNSLVLSRINYGITCWGFDNKRIYKLQKKALRIICKTKYNAHSDPLFKKMKTLKVKDIFHIRCLSFFYHHEKNNLPTYFRNFISSNIVEHPHNTRQRGNLRNDRTNRISSEKILRYFLPTFLRTVSIDITNSVYTHTLQTVKLKFKNFSLERYESSCSLRQCYVCNR